MLHKVVNNKTKTLSDGDTPVGYREVRLVSS